MIINLLILQNYSKECNHDPKLINIKVIQRQERKRLDDSTRWKGLEIKFETTSYQDLDSSQISALNFIYGNVKNFI